MAVKFGSLKITVEGTHNNVTYKITLEKPRPTAGISTPCKSFLLRVEGEGVTQANAKNIASEILAAEIQDSDLDE